MKKGENMKNEKLIEEYISKNKLDIEKVVDDYYNYITTIIKNSYWIYVKFLDTFFENFLFSRDHFHRSIIF